VKGRLGSPENKAMKLLTTSFFTLVLLRFAGGSYGQTDFEVTKFLAEQGEAFAQYNLGVMYENGDGVRQNNVRAYAWWSVAAAHQLHRNRTHQPQSGDDIARAGDVSAG
jgi:TPR repeat protein